MKKIMFNDKYGLTEAVLKGFKTQTRRICKESQLRRILHIPKSADRNFDEIVEGCMQDEASKYEVELFAPYAIDTIVAVAQCMRDVYADFDKRMLGQDTKAMLTRFGGNEPSYSNKMFVRAESMPHHIMITGVRIERLQDISEEDVLAEGFEHRSVNNGWGNMASHWEYQLHYLDNLGRDCDITGFTHKEAYSYLIEKLNPNTWEKNPYVFVYDFKLKD